MQRSIALITVTVMLLAGLLWTIDAWARAGGGGSFGSRGSRSYSAPIRPGPPSPSRPPAPPAFPPPPAQRPGWMSGLMGGIGGLLLGGLIGSLLFGAMGRGLFGGIGLIELLVIAGLIFFAVSYLRRRQPPEAALGGAYGTPQDTEGAPWRSASEAPSPAAIEVPRAPSDLDRGVEYIRQMDLTFDPARFVSTASDVFFKVQAAWTVRDMGSVRELLASEMRATLQTQCDRLRAEHRINRLENIAIRSAEVTEAWQEGGSDFVTVRFLANVLDYTVDEPGNQVIEGSRTEPVKFEEYWTFIRPVGPNSWKLSAIQQAP